MSSSTQITPRQKLFRNHKLPIEKFCAHTFITGTHKTEKCKKFALKGKTLCMHHANIESSKKVQCILILRSGPNKGKRCSKETTHETGYCVGCRQKKYVKAKIGLTNKPKISKPKLSFDNVDDIESEDNEVAENESPAQVIMKKILKSVEIEKQSPVSFDDSDDDQDDKIETVKEKIVIPARPAVVNQERKLAFQPIVKIHSYNKYDEENEEHEDEDEDEDDEELEDD